MSAQSSSLSQRTQIQCSVCNCVYNDHEHNRCTAQTISVGPHFACCTSDTVCASFQPE